MKNTHTTLTGPAILLTHVWLCRGWEGLIHCRSWLLSASIKKCVNLRWSFMRGSKYIICTFWVLFLPNLADVHPNTLVPPRLNSDVRPTLARFATIPSSRRHKYNINSVHHVLSNPYARFVAPSCAWSVLPKPGPAIVTTSHWALRHQLLLLPLIPDYWRRIHQAIWHYILPCNGATGFDCSSNLRAPPGEHLRLAHLSVMRMIPSNGM